VGQVRQQELGEEMNQCEGICVLDGDCTGTVHYTTVSGFGSADNFWYCDTAISYDRHNGFTVEVKP
jgi:hypothetical protein